MGCAFFYSKLVLGSFVTRCECGIMYGCDIGISFFYFLFIYYGV